MRDFKRLVMWGAVIAFTAIAARALASGSPLPAPRPEGGMDLGPAGSAIDPASSPWNDLPSDGYLPTGADPPAHAAQPSGADLSGRPRTAELAIEDAELVLGPSQAGFDTAAAVALYGGALAHHFELLDGVNSSAAEVVDIVAMDHSVSPALLLVMLELASRALTGPGPLSAPLGDTAAAVRGESLHTAAGRIAAWLNDAYYADRHRGGRLLGSQSGRSARSPDQPNAAQTAVAHALATLWPGGSDEAMMTAFAETYGRLVGDLPAEQSPPPIPDGLEQPPLLLPWPEGEAWHFTGGPHGSWGSGSAWGAIDFAPPSPVGCSAAPEWVIASAPGTVMSSRQGQVLVDLDGDGSVHTGWVVLYQHMSTGERVPVGKRLQAGDRIGHPSCEGGFSTGSHLHFARRFNGEWLPAAGGPVPLVLSGWTFTSGSAEYDGEMSHEDAGERVALKRRNGRITSVTSDNDEAERAANAVAWSALDRTGFGSVASTGPAAGTAPSQPGVQDAHSGSLFPTWPPGESVSVDDGSAHLGSVDTGSFESDLSEQVATANSADTVSVQAADTGQGAAFGDGSSAPKLIVRLLLQGRRRHDTGFVVALERPGEPPIGLLGHTDEAGTSGPIAMPYYVEGLYDVVLRAPGFTQARVIAAPIEHGVVEIDFSSGGLTPLRAGDLNGDSAVNASDMFAWFDARRDGRDSADLDGDGEADFGDFLRMILPVLRDG